MSVLDSPEFLEKIKSGDPEAVRDLHTQMFIGLGTYLVRTWGLSETEAMSLANYVIFKACKKIHTFKGDSKLTSWIFTLAKNKVIDSYRKRFHTVEGQSEPRDAFDADKKNLLSFDDPEQADTFPEPSTGITEEVTGESRKKRLARRAWLSLPKSSRRALLKSEYKKMTDKEIAEEEGVKEGTIRTRRSRAKKQLKKALDQVYEESE